MRKKILIITCLVALLALSFIGFGYGYGWFINQSNTEPIDANTKGIVFSYKVSDGIDEKTDVLAYSVKNVSFFDKDSEDEGKYFLDMALEIEFKITNVCDYDLAVSLEFTADEATTGPHLEGLLTSEKITSTTNYTTVENVLEDKKVGDDANRITLPNKIGAKGNTDNVSVTGTAYLYLFGVQPDDAANNEFLDETYGFSVLLSAVRYKEQ